MHNIIALEARFAWRLAGAVITGSEGQHDVDFCGRLLLMVRLLFLALLALIL